MIRFGLVSCFALLSTTAFGQTPPGIDWSKPVVGVDAPTPTVVKDVEVLVEVQTIQTSSDSRAAPLPPPCEPPPTADKPAQKPPGPSPCPATR
jgi:hypothetical protein